MVSASLDEAILIRNGQLVFRRGLSKFLNAFHDVFKNAPQRRHFQAYIVGLIIYLGSRNLAGLSRAIPDGKSASSLYRFVAQSEWDIDRVEEVHGDMLNRRTRRALQAMA